MEYPNREFLGLKHLKLFVIQIAMKAKYNFRDEMCCAMH